jgi:hypothetical protein
MVFVFTYFLNYTFALLLVWTLRQIMKKTPFYLLILKVIFVGIQNIFSIQLSVAITPTPEAVN